MRYAPLEKRSRMESEIWQYLKNAPPEFWIGLAVGLAFERLIALRKKKGKE